jgi:GNAT superfamily N-acetyltransferase
MSGAANSEQHSLGVRRAADADLQLLLELIAEFCAIDQHRFEREAITRALAPLLSDDRYGVVWLMDAPSLGYAVITWGYSLESRGVEGLVDEIYVRERGRGIGSAFMEFIIDDLRSRGIARMFLETERHNSSVRRFYGRAGFAEDDSIWMSRWL